MDWRQNRKGQPYRKLNGITSVYEDKTVLHSILFFFWGNVYNFIRSRKKPTFIHKNLEHKPTTVQWGSGRTVEGFSSIVCHQNPHTFFWVLVTSRNKWVTDTIYDISYHVYRLSPSVVPNIFLTDSPHRRRQHHFTPTLADMNLWLPGLQAVRWLFLTNSSKPIILVWMEALQSAFF